LAISDSKNKANASTYVFVVATSYALQFIDSTLIYRGQRYEKSKIEQNKTAFIFAHRGTDPLCSQGDRPSVTKINLKSTDKKVGGKIWEVLHTILRKKCIFAE
jgi:hypothetical protein